LAENDYRLASTGVSWTDDEEPPRHGEAPWDLADGGSPYPVRRSAFGTPGIPPGSLWQSGVRDWIPRRCVACGWLILPGQGHHRIEQFSRPTRRIHYSYCPFAPVPPEDRRRAVLEEINAWLAALVMTLFAALIGYVLMMICGWRP
jgi:hypothetical protein